MKTEESEINFQEIWKLFAETDLKFKETDLKFKETDLKFKETDLKFKESEQRLEKLFKNTDQKIDRLTGKWGRFVEGMIVPAAEKLFRERGIDINSISQRVKRRKENEQIEIDILAIDTLYAVLIEVKSTLSVDDVKEHIERLGQFKYFFTEYRDRKVMGAVAGIVIDEGADKYAYRNGLFVIGQTSDNVQILNDDKFKPKEW